MYRSALPSLFFCLPSSKPLIAQCGYLVACRIILQYARGEKKTFVIVKCKRHCKCERTRGDSSVSQYCQHCDCQAGEHETPLPYSRFVAALAAVSSVSKCLINEKKFLPFYLDQTLLHTCWSNIAINFVCLARIFKNFCTWNETAVYFQKFVGENWSRDFKCKRLLRKQNRWIYCKKRSLDCCKYFHTWIALKNFFQGMKRINMIYYMFKLSQIIWKPL